MSGNGNIEIWGALPIERTNSIPRSKEEKDTDKKIKAIIENPDKENRKTQIVEYMFDKRVFSPIETEIIHKMLNTLVQPSEFDDAEEYKNYLNEHKDIIEHLVNINIDQLFSGIEKWVDKVIVAKTLESLWYGVASKTWTDLEATWEIRRTSDQNNLHFLHIINPNLDISNLDTKTFVLEIKKYRALQYLQQPEQNRTLEPQQQNTKNKIQEYAPLSKMKEELFSDPEILQSAHNFAQKVFQIDLSKKYDENTENANYLKQQEALKFLTSEYTQEFLVHIINQKEAQVNGKTTKGQQISIKYIAESMQYRYNALLRDEKIESLENQAIKEREKERKDIILGLMRYKADIIEYPEVKNIENATEKTKKIGQLLKDKLNTKIESPDSLFHNQAEGIYATYADVCKEPQIIALLKHTLIDDIIAENRTGEGENLLHNITSLQIYAYLLLKSDDSRLAEGIEFGWDGLGEQVKNLITIIDALEKEVPIDENFLNGLSGEWKALGAALSKAHQEHKVQFQKFCNENNLQPPPSRLSNMSKFNEEREQRISKMREATQEQVKSGEKIWNLEGKRVLAASKSVNTFLEQDKDNQPSDIQQRINKIFEERELRHTQTSMITHIQSELEELGLDAKNIFQNGIPQEEARLKEMIVQALLTQSHSNEDAQPQADEITQHILNIQQEEKMKKSSDDEEKSEKSQQEFFENTYKQVKLEALGVVFDTLSTYLSASPSTENFQLENVDQIEIKKEERTLIIKGHINGMPTSFAYNLDNGLISSNKAVAHDNVEKTYNINQTEPKYPLFHLKDFKSLQQVWLGILEEQQREREEKIKNSNPHATWPMTPDQDRFRERTRDKMKTFREMLGEWYSPESIFHQQVQLQSNVRKDQIMTELATIINSKENPSPKFNKKTHPDVYELLRIVDRSIHTAQDAALLNSNIQRLLKLIEHDKGWLNVEPHTPIHKDEQRVGYKSGRLRLLFNKGKIENDRIIVKNGNEQRSNKGKIENDRIIVKNGNEQRSNNGFLLFVKRFINKPDSEEPINFNDMRDCLTSIETGNEQWPENPYSELDKRYRDEEEKLKAEWDKQAANNLINTEADLAYNSPPIYWVPEGYNPEKNILQA